jgi:hypothetical protein
MDILSQQGARVQVKWLKILNGFKNEVADGSTGDH